MKTLMILLAFLAFSVRPHAQCTVGDAEFEYQLAVIQMQEALRMETIQFDGMGSDWNPWSEWDANQWLLGVGSMSRGSVYADQPFGGWMLAVDWVGWSVELWEADNGALEGYQVALMRAEAALSAESMFNGVLQGQVDHLSFLWDQRHAYTLYGFEIARLNAWNHRAAGNSCEVVFDFYRATVAL